MSGTFHRRVGVLFATAAAALGVWKWVPGTEADRAVFETVASGLVNGPLFVSGDGSAASPWGLRAFVAEVKQDKKEAPVVVSLGDDPDGVFKSSPAAPIDMAVIFSNFQRLGATKAATAAVLAWEAPDAAELASLELVLDRFDALAMAAPLSRGPVPSPMPPAFRRASVPVTDVHGDASDLPRVNRIQIPGVIFGGDKALAGFSVLESEPHGDFPPLLARWDDRVVFSFPLLVVLQRLNLPPAGVEIRPGKFLRLSSDGPVVPIDEYGQLARSLRPLAPYKEISAEALIDGGDELFPKHAPDPVILRDDRSAAEPATRAFSKSLAAVIAAVASEGGMSDARTYPRLRLGGEVGVMAGAVLVLTALCGLAVFRRNVAALVMVLVVVSAQWIGFSAGVWLPALPVLGGVAAMLLVSPLFKQRVRVLAEASPEREKVAVVELPPLREAVEEDTWESRPENFPAAVVQPLAEEEWSYQPTVKAPEPPPVSTVDDEWVYRPEDFRHNAPLVDDSWLYHTAEAVPEIEPEPEAEPTTRPVQPAPAVSVEPKPHGRSHREPVKKTAANKAPAKKDQKQAGKSRKPRRGKPPFSGS